MKKGILYVSVGLLLTGIGLWVYNKYGKKSDDTKSVGGSSGTSSPSGSSDNFNRLITNLGAGNKPNNDGIVIVPFNDHNNRAQFYNNNRIVIFQPGMMGTNETIVAKGGYSNGGLTITLDGRTPISSSSVYTNLLKTISGTNSGSSLSISKQGI